MLDDGGMTGQPQFQPYPQTPQGLGYPPVPVAPDGRPLADAGDRFLARLLDGLITVGVVIVGFLPLVIATSLLLRDHGTAAAVIDVVWAVLVFLGVPYLYEVEYALCHNGRTVGKRVLHTAIIPAQPGAPLSRGILAKRWGVMELFNLLSNCYVGLLDPLWLLWDKPYRQCLHDKAARTVVIKQVG
jgi:uncharacterized RDD family membrane protein YckC